SYIVLGLDSVHIKVPVAVPLGTSVTLVCECDLSDEDLYSVKWYKGKREFFRYTSKEIPSIKIFPKAGISVNVNLSNASHLVLDGIEPQSSGRYSCEITEAAPSFHTQIASRTMHVVDLPEVDPRIDDMKSYYGADEFLEVRCTAGASLPAAKLTWLINDRPLLLPLQEPSRLESLTLPADDGPSSSSGSSNSSSSKRSSSSTNSSSKQKASVKSSSQVPAAVSQTLDQERMEEGHEQSGNMVVGGAPTASALTEGLMATDTARTKPGSRTTNASASAASEKFGNRYEVAVSQLKLLLEHGHFQMGKLKVSSYAFGVGEFMSHQAVRAVHAI
uniref:Ig-like domain-containing protein n=1 Tax=Anopheles albimanus TaxID=7167 RepID=A0A182FBW7_ANOAL